MSTKISFTVTAAYNDKQMKIFLRQFCGVSASLLTSLKRTQDGITLNGSHARSVDIVHAGDTVVLSLSQDESDIPPSDLPCCVIYEDEHVIAYDKPPFMTVHPVRGHLGDTLANAAAGYAQSKGERYAFRAVNRLDRDTSGVVLAAKNSFAAALLPKSAHKTYVGVCEGIITKPGTVRAPIRLKSGHTIERETGEGGAPAVTHYVPIAQFGERTLLEFTLETGRTHQIRVHMSSIGHPLAGDDMYGSAQSKTENICAENSTADTTDPPSGACFTKNYAAARMTQSELETAWNEYFLRKAVYIEDILNGRCTEAATRSDRFIRQALHCAKVEFIHPITKEKVTVRSSLPPEFSAAGRR